jgi:hypothetical protein
MDQLPRRVWKILIFGLLVGAGLPTLFAVGLHPDLYICGALEVVVDCSG